MNSVYKYMGYSKQAFHQKMDRHLCDREQQLLLLPIIAELRLEHPGVGARELYLILQPDSIGRDRFERLCFEYGFKLERLKCYRRTTDSSGVIRFPNLIAGVELKGINHAWSSDITYYQIGDTFYYLTFIMDLFSRKIVGFSVSKRLLTEQTTIPALAMALQQRNATGVIFHSDGGGQYYCKEFLKLTASCQMKNSMCDSVFENPHAERINGTIKNQYIKGYQPGCYDTLIKMTARAVYNYNCVRPHKSLKKITPEVFEKLWSEHGGSLSNDVFWNLCIKFRQHQKKSHLTMSSDININFKPLDKTVNVF